jgi:hypothetical protein
MVIGPGDDVTGAPAPFATFPFAGIVGSHACVQKASIQEIQRGHVSPFWAILRKEQVSHKRRGPASRHRCGQLAGRPCRVVSATRHTGVVDREAPTEPPCLGPENIHRNVKRSGLVCPNCAAIRDASDPAPGTEFLGPETAPPNRPDPAVKDRTPLIARH